VKALIREFRLSPPGKGQGVSCDENDVLLGAIPLLKRSRSNGKDPWQPIKGEQLSEDIGTQFGLPIDISRKMVFPPKPPNERHSFPWWLFLPWVLPTGGVPA
jgi:hypothetical protein